MLTLILGSVSVLGAQDHQPGEELKDWLKTYQLSDRPTADIEGPGIHSDLSQLGKKLFFSPDLSLDGKVACSTCHHPRLGGADSLALPVGVTVDDPFLTGQPRLDQLIKLSPDDYVRHLIPRNSPTVFNVSLYRKNLFWDGRVQYVDSDVSSRKIKVGGGYSELPTSRYQTRSLLQAQARLPMVSPFEMKGLSDASHNNLEIHQLIVSRLASSDEWCRQFKSVFSPQDTNVSCEAVVQIDTLTKALAAFQADLVLIENRFFGFLNNKNKLSESEMKGARLFFTAVSEGGAGCSGCHSGSHFSDEQFYNLGIEPSGPGVNGRGLDYGRSNIEPDTDTFSFRTPSLLNISRTAPYFHNGSAATLSEAIKAHIRNKPEKSLSDSNKGDSNRSDVAYMKRSLTTIREKAAQSPFQKLLPEALSDHQVDQLSAFLETLTDPCLLDESCFQVFIDDQPIVTPFTRPVSLEESSAEKLSAVPRQTVDKMEIRTPSFEKCVAIPAVIPVAKTNQNRLWFREAGAKKGIDHRRKVGLIKPGWIMDVINWGGVSAADLNRDCLDDLVFADNDNRVWVYYQQSDGQFKQQNILLKGAELKGVITPLVGDLDGDYQPDLFLGNDGRFYPQVVYDFTRAPESLVFSDVSGPTLNASFGDLDQDGDLDAVMAFWRTYKSVRQPQIWRNSGYRQMQPADSKVPELRESYGPVTLNDGLIHQKHEAPVFGGDDFTFTPNFADVNQDGISDILMTADFFTTQLWKNTGTELQDVTDIREIHGSFGMGAAIADFDNDGDLDWFESSIFSLSQSSSYTGNRLYQNEGDYQFRNVTENSGLREGGWGWGSCAADFNNDGLLDIFHATGYGNIPETATYPSQDYKTLATQILNNHSEFQQSRARLFINLGEMTFKEQALEAGLEKAMDGRGISCFDYQQDGDIDIVVSNWEGSPDFFVNSNPDNHHWLSVRLIGPPGNTEALGAKIRLYSQDGTQFREVRFENNFVSTNPRQQHFGLKQLEKVDRLVIDWPKPYSARTVLENPRINQRHLVFHPVLNQQPPSGTNR
ncbi:cytochrome c peroxidase [Endozoicomonas sp. 8E]|uniref:cytochrome c peroxidase n=1 Tax=Endozoicomonas sp. 8E TaxID=3035692 RepID=UPI0029392C96|nr:cytochrome c peroxidase [Endozoicomonas sp. 8E]WOG28714.1 cytochrome c peroxidase [Endozoicomonas sp. 8E]